MVHLGSHQNKSAENLRTYTAKKGCLLFTLDVSVWTVPFHF